MRTVVSDGGTFLCVQLITEEWMNAEELIQSLIDDLNDLTYLDERSLTRLRMRSKMIIRKIFADSSGYLEDIDLISFPHIPYLSEPKVSAGFRREQDWDSAKLKMLALFEAMQEDIKLFDGAKNSFDFSETEFKLSNRIFVVHGHDGEMKESVARTLGRIDLEPIILHEQPNRGLTIIEKCEDNSNVDFAVVLLSPDDKGCPKSDFPKGAKPRARQNVIFELGFFIGKLGRNRVAALYRGEDIEIPSDYDGVVYIPYDTSDGWKLKLVRELKECGYDIDMNKL